MCREGPAPLAPGTGCEGEPAETIRAPRGLLLVDRIAAFGAGAQWPNVNQLRFTKSAGWPLVNVR